MQLVLTGYHSANTVPWYSVLSQLLTGVKALEIKIRGGKNSELNVAAQPSLYENKAGISFELILGSLDPELLLPCPFAYDYRLRIQM